MFSIEFHFKVEFEMKLCYFRKNNQWFTCCSNIQWIDCVSLWSTNSCFQLDTYYFNMEFIQWTQTLHQWWSLFAIIDFNLSKSQCWSIIYSSWNKWFMSSLSNISTSYWIVFWFDWWILCLQSRINIKWHLCFISLINVHIDIE